MQITIISNDGSIRLLSYDDNSTFTDDVKNHKYGKDLLEATVLTIEPNLKLYSHKEISLAPVEQAPFVREVIGKKMRVKNSYNTSKKLYNEFITHFGKSKNFMNCGRFVLKSQAGRFQLEGKIKELR